jgi:hypothetical protein
VLQRAICPGRGASDALTAIAGVTHVYVSNDLQVGGAGPWRDGHAAHLRLAVGGAVGRRHRLRPTKNYQTTSSPPHPNPPPTATTTTNQVVKAYVSIYSDERGKAEAMTNLKRLEP